MENSVTSHSIMIIAGDPSGDIHAAPIIRQLYTIDPSVEIWGIGGSQMVNEGFTSLMPFESFNKMGFIEVISHLPFFLNAKKRLIGEMKIRKPDCLVCVDYPGFNMPMMKASQSLGIPVVWYIAPMVWAWKQKRAAILGKCAAHIACIFPFEVEYFLPYTNKVSFVGNPTVESGDFDIKNRPSVNNNSFSIAIIPGSREQEVKRLLKPMLEAFSILKSEFPFVTATVSRFSSLKESLFNIVSEYEGVITKNTPIQDILKFSDCAIVTSGTATLETALSGVPMVISYKTSLLTYSLAKLLVKIKFIGLPNIIAKKEIVPECVQNEMNSQMVASKVRKFITDKEYYKTTVDELTKLKELLGAQKPSIEVANIIKKCIDHSSTG